MLNELVLETPRNNFRPPVKSYVFRREGTMRGKRLVSWESLQAHIESMQSL